MSAEARGDGAAQHDHNIAFSEALQVWLKVAALSFGGPAGQIAVMHRLVVEEKRWVGDRRFLHALNYCMLLPGPEAQQLAIYLGWLLHGVRGGVVAGTLFVLPGFVSIMALSVLYAAYGQVGLIAGLFFGLKAAVLAVVLQALVRIGRRALNDWPLRAIALAAFVAIFFFDVPYPAIVLGAGLTGFLLSRAQIIGPHRATSAAKGPVLDDASSAVGTATPAHARRDLRHSARICGALALMWLAPVAGLLWWLGPEDVFARLALFFSQMAVVTFGGAYAVLAYVAQEAVQNYGWLRPGEMLDGLGMAETTPGPLIQVVQFVGFLAAFREAGGLDPYLAGILGAVIVTWVTFLPSFLWIFLGAPHIEALRGQAALGVALSAITAAVFGVVLNLAIWFSMHVIFARVDPWRGWGMRIELPVPGTLDPAALFLSLLAILALFRLRLGMTAVLLGSALIGAAWKAVEGTI